MIAGSPIGACYVNEKGFLLLVQQWNMIRWHEKSHRLSLEKTASEMVQRICCSLFWDSVRIAAKHTMPGDIPWQAYFLCGRRIRQTLLQVLRRYHLPSGFRIFYNIWRSMTLGQNLYIWVWETVRKKQEIRWWRQSGSVSGEVMSFCWIEEFGRFWNGIQAIISKMPESGDGERICLGDEK